MDGGLLLFFVSRALLPFPWKIVNLDGGACSLLAPTLCSSVHLVISISIRTLSVRAWTACQDVIQGAEIRRALIAGCILLFAPNLQVIWSTVGKILATARTVAGSST